MSLCHRALSSIQFFWINGNFQFIEMKIQWSFSIERKSTWISFVCCSFLCRSIFFVHSFVRILLSAALLFQYFVSPFNHNNKIHILTKWFTKLIHWIQSIFFSLFISHTSHHHRSSARMSTYNINGTPFNTSNRKIAHSNTVAIRFRSCHHSHIERYVCGWHSHTQFEILQHTIGHAQGQ